MPDPVPRHKTGKIVVVGVGNVGATFAYTCLLMRLVSDIVLIDLDKERAEGEAMDLRHAVPLAHPVRIRTGGYEECGDADVVMIAAGVSQRAGESRLDLLKRNADVFRKIVPEIVRANPEIILLVATNPVDVMTYVAWQLSGLPSGQVIGSGTVLDTSRLRSLIGNALQIDSRNVHAQVIGEHGDSEVIVWSRATAGGIPLGEFCECCERQITAEMQGMIAAQTRGAAYEIIQRKGATSYAISATLARIVECIMNDQRSILTVSSLIPERFDLGRVYLGFPAIVGRSGVLQTLRVPLSAEESAAVGASASAMRNILDAMGYPSS